MKMALGNLDSQKNSSNDIFAAAERTSKLAVKPSLYQFCGTEDSLYGDNIKIRDFADGLVFDILTRKPQVDTCGGFGICTS